VSAVAEACSKHDHALKLFPAVVHAYYDLENEAQLVTEEAIMEWHNNFKAQSAGEERVFAEVKPLIKWFEDAAEESSDEESEGEN